MRWQSTNLLSSRVLLSNNPSRPGFAAITLGQVFALPLVRNISIGSIDLGLAYAKCVVQHDM
jgi:hypothetical protein